MQKNVAGQKWKVFAFNRTTNVPLTGDAANITANIDIDFAGAGATNDVNPTEQEDGFYTFDLTQAESNGKQLSLYPVSSTGDIQVIAVPGTIFTTPANFPDLGIESDGDLTKVNTLDGHTAQTGDSFARIGVAGAGLTNINLPNQVMDIAGNITGSLSGSVGSVAGNVDGNVTGSVGSISGITFPTNFGDLSISVTAGLVNITQSAADKAWSTATRILTSGTNIVLAKGVGVTGFNDLSGPQVNAECDTAISDALLATAADIAALNDISTAEVLTQVNAAIDTAISELGVAAPTATPTLRTGMMLMYMALRNQLVTQTSGTDALEIRNNAGTIIAKKLITDDGVDYTEAKMISG